MAEPQAPTSYSSTFPASPPASLVDPAVIAAHDQETFHGLNRLLCHWDRPHRTSYHWLLGIGEHPEAVALAERCQAHLPLEGLDYIPSRWLHLTIQRLAYHDEIDEQQIGSAIAEVERATEGIDPFPLSLIPLAGSSGAVRFSVAPWEQLFEIYRAVTVGPKAADLDPLDVFRPHVGIAYSATQQLPDQISLGVTAAAAAETPVAVPVAELLLVRMWRATGWYEWEELERVRLT